MSARNAARAGKRGNICVGNNVSSFARAFRSYQGDTWMFLHISRSLTFSFRQVLTFFTSAYEILVGERRRNDINHDDN